MIHPRAQKAIDVMRAGGDMVPPDLFRHLEMVYEASSILSKAFDLKYPGLIDPETVMIGASVHDLGKAIFTEELFAPGRDHVDEGPSILVKAGLEEQYCRFAKTHQDWKGTALEDLLVALSDVIWKGKRNDELEDAICANVMVLKGLKDKWSVWSWLDHLIIKIAKHADDRIVYQRYGKRSEELMLVR